MIGAGCVWCTGMGMGTGIGTGSAGCGGGGSGSVLYGGGGQGSAPGVRGALARRTRRLRAGSSVWHSALATLRSRSVCTPLFTLRFDTVVVGGSSCTCTMFTFTLDTFCRLGSPGTRTETESDLRSGAGAGTGNRIS